MKPVPVALTLMLVIGFALIVVGVAKLSVPFAYIVAGLFLIVIVFSQGAQIMRGGRG